MEKATYSRTSMARFFILPPRECVEHLTKEFFEKLLPGLEVSDLWPQIAELLQQQNPDCFIVHREDLTNSGDDDELAEVYGAEEHDEIHELSLPIRNQPAQVCRRFVKVSISETSQRL
jgi:hypothetical protein